MLSIKLVQDLVHLLTSLFYQYINIMCGWGK